MFRFFQRPIPLVLGLAFLTTIPVLTALVQVVQIPTGTYPDDSARLAFAPIAWFAHVLAGVAFGITGPVQFVRALRHRFGALHRVSGRIFVVSGAVLGLSGLALLGALALALAAIRDRDVMRHRAWMIRAYAIGMGLGAVGLVFFPIYLVTGRAPTGLGSDLLFVGSWLMSILLGETIIRRTSRPSVQVPA